MNQSMIGEEEEEKLISKLGEEKVENISCKKQIENRLLTAFSVMLESTQLSNLFAIILIILCYMQLIGRGFEAVIRLSPDGDLNVNFEKVIMTLRAVDLMAFLGGSELFYCVGYAILLLNWWNIVGWMFLSYFDKSSNSWLGALAHQSSILNYICYWVLLDPMIDFVSSIYACHNRTLEEQFLIECWGTSHLVHSVMFGILSVGIINVLLIAILGNDSNPYNLKNPFRRFAWNFEIYFVLLRIIYISCTVFLQHTEFEYICVFILVILALFCFFSYISFLPYYESSISDLFGAGSIALLWVSVNVLLHTFLDMLGYSYNGCLAIAFTGILPSYFLSRKWRNYFLKTLIYQKKTKDIRSENHYQLYLQSLIKLHDKIVNRNSSIEEEMALMGFLALHKSECRTKLCPLKNEEIYYLPLAKLFSETEYGKQMTDPVTILHLIRRLFDLRISRYDLQDDSFARIRSSASPELMICAAYFSICRIGNFHYASLKMNNAVEFDGSLQIRGAILRVKRLVETTQLQKNEEKWSRGRGKEASIDVRKVFEYEAHLSQFKSEMLSVAENQKKIWNELLLPLPDFNKVHKWGTNILCRYEHVKQGWNTIKNMDCRDSKVEMMYGMFLTDIMSNKEEAATHVRIANLIGKDVQVAIGEILINDSDTLFENGSAVIMISAMEETFHNILRASNGISQIFEYTPADLVGHDVSMLMPTFIAKRHSDFVKHYLKNGKANTLNKTFDSFGVDKEQFIFQICLYVRQYYDIKYESIFLALVRQYSIREALIITDPIGKILAISEEVFKDLTGITPISIQENDIYIFYICPELIEFDFEKNEATVMTTFQVPSNLLTIANEISNIKKAKDSEDFNRSNKRSEKIKEITSLIRDKKLVYSHMDKPSKWCKITSATTVTSDSSERMSIKVISYNANIFDDDFSEMNSYEGSDLIQFDMMEEQPREEQKTTEPEVTTPIGGLNKKLNSLQQPGSSLEESKIDDQNSEFMRQDLSLIPLANLKKQQEEALVKREESKVKLSSLSILEKKLQVLQKSIDSDYFPRPLQISGWIALCMFLLILSSITFLFVFHLITYSDINNQKELRQYSRQFALMRIFESTRSIILLGTASDGYPILNYTARSSFNYGSIVDSQKTLSYTYWKLYDLLNSTKELHENEQKMLFRSMTMSSDNIKYLMNPNVTLYFSVDQNQEKTQQAHSHTAISLISNSAFSFYSKLLLGNSNYLRDLHYLIVNGLYTPLQITMDEFNGILFEGKHLFSQEKLIALAVACSMAGLLIACLVGFIPIFNFINKENSRILRLLLHIRSSHLESQIKSCNRFITFIQFESAIQEDPIISEDSLQNIDQPEKDKNKYVKKKNKLRENRNVIEYKSKIFYELLKIFFVFIILECYYIYFAVKPSYFFKTIYHHIEEEIYLQKIKNYNMLLYGLTFEMIGTIDSTKLYGNKLGPLLANFSKESISRLTELSECFRENQDIFSLQYRTQFKNIIFSNLCDSEVETNTTECENIAGDILKKGLYFSNVYFINTLSKIREEYLATNSSEQNVSLARTLLNDDQIISIEIIFRRYIDPAIRFLVNANKESISSNVKGECPVYIILYVSFLIVLCLIYFVFWKLFVSSLKKGIMSSLEILLRMPLNILLNTSFISSFINDEAHKLALLLHQA